MAWVLTILGIVLLIILHEVGHFAVAKAVGMRVERFSLFFRRGCSVSSGEKPTTWSGRSPPAAT